jgi:predicted CXXCH cytochrome family protein
MICFFFYALLVWALRPQQVPEHPVALAADFDGAQCTECHAEKQQGKHVHSAMAMGCTACHTVETKGETTRIGLTAPAGEICLTCHELAKVENDGMLHRPYEQKRCIVCHDPHSSEFTAQTRAPMNAMCLACHRERATVGESVELFAGQKLSGEEFNQIPKIGLDPTLKFGHPMGNHKVADAPNPLQPGEKISCLTCHENHAATRAKLIRMTEFKGKKMDVCDACHLANDEANMAEAQKRADALEAQRQKEEQMRSKQPSTMPQKPPKPKDKKP